MAPESCCEGSYALHRLKRPYYERYDSALSARIIMALTNPVALKLTLSTILSVAACACAMTSIGKQSFPFCYSTIFDHVPVLFQP